MGAGAAADSGQADVINLRIRAPYVAAGNRNFEFARQVVKIIVAPKRLADLQSQWRCVANLVRVDSRDGASGNVAGYVTAGAHRAKAALLKGVEHFRQSLDGDPVQLNVLPDRE